jgi:hypothetical protein
MKAQQPGEEEEGVEASSTKSASLKESAEAGSRRIR